MYLWQEVYFRFKGANLINLTAVWTNLVFSNEAAHFCMLHLFQDLSHIAHDTVKFFMVGKALFVGSFYCITNSVGRIFTGQFFFHLNGFFQVFIVGSDNFSLELWINLQQLDFGLFLADSCHDLILEIQEFLNSCMPFQKGFQHDFL